MPNNDYVPLLNSAIASFGIPPARKASDYLNAYQGWAFSCINAIAQEVASMSIHLYKKKTVRNKVEVEEVTEHEALSIINYVNDYSTFYDHMFATQTYVELLGEAYWGILRDSKKQVASLWILRPDWIEVNPSASKLIDHYTYRVGGTFGGGESIELAPTDVVPFRMINPSVPYRGKGSVQAGAMAIDLDDFSAQYNRNFFFNSALPSIFFKTDRNISEAEINRFLASFRAKFQGVSNSNKVAFLTGGLDIKELGASLKDMDFAEQRRAMRDEILAIFRVPKSIIGITEDVNRANAEQGKKTFIDNVITPKIRMIVDHLNEFYLTNWANEDLFFDYDDPSPEDTELKLKVYANAISNGWMTRNEVRAEENLEPVEGLDTPLMPSNMVEVGTSASNEQKILRRKAEKRNEKASKSNIRVPITKLGALRRKKLLEGIKPDLVRIISLAMKQEEEPRDVKEEFRQAYWKQTIEKTDLWENEMRQSLVKLFKEQEQTVLDNLTANTTKSIKKKVSAAVLLFGLLAETRKFKDQFKPFIKRIVETKALDELDFLGVGGSFRMTDEVINYLEDEGLKFCKTVNETTREKLKQSLVDGINLDEDTDQLTKRIRDVYQEATQSRAQTIARTEVLHANNFAVQESYRQSGVVVGKEWLTAIDERTCPYCADLDTKILPLKGEFYSSEFGDVREPPLHPNCRCTTIPVLDKDLLRSLPDEMMMKKLRSVAEDAKKEVVRAKKEKDKIVGEAQREKERIVGEAIKQAEEEKKQITGELKKIRNEVKKKLKDEQE